MVTYFVPLQLSKTKSMIQTNDEYSARDIVNDVRL